MHQRSNFHAKDLFYGIFFKSYSHSIYAKVEIGECEERENIYYYIIIGKHFLYIIFANLNISNNQETKKIKILLFYSYKKTYRINLLYITIYTI